MYTCIHIYTYIQTYVHTNIQTANSIQREGKEIYESNICHVITMQRIEVLPCSSHNGRARINTKSTETESEKLRLEKQRKIQ